MKFPTSGTSETAGIRMPGEGKITIKTHTRDHQAHIEIRDSGMGIPKDQIERLFEPAFSKKGKRVKVAIGLFSSYNIIQKHRGNIKVRSTPGKGSCFTVILPIQGKGNTE